MLSLLLVSFFIYDCSLYVITAFFVHHCLFYLVLLSLFSFLIILYLSLRFVPMITARLLPEHRAIPSPTPRPPPPTPQSVRACVCASRTRTCFHTKDCYVPLPIYHCRLSLLSLSLSLNYVSMIAFFICCLRYLSLLSLFMVFFMIASFIYYWCLHL